MHCVFRPRQNFVYTTGPANKRRSPGFSFTLLMFLLGLGLFLGGASMFLKRISCQVAVSDASDIVSAEVNRVITSIMAGGDAAALARACGFRTAWEYRGGDIVEYML